MTILITGGAGFLGQRLTRRLIELGEVAGRPVDQIVLVDQVAAPDFGDRRVRAETADISAPEAVRALVTPDVDLVFHLAAVVSGAAEADFDLGMRVNLDASRLLLEQCRQA